jgi:hypothetical protein
VHDDIAVVDEQPAGVQRALLVMRRYLLSLEAPADLILNSADLPLAFPATDYEVVGKAAQVADIQQDDVAGLFIAGRLRGPSGYFECLQTDYLRCCYDTIISQGRRFINEPSLL